MRLFKISQNRNINKDTFDAAIVAADNENEARITHPDLCLYKFNEWDGGVSHVWCESKFVKVEYIGEAKEGTKKGVVVASFYSSE